MRATVRGAAPGALPSALAQDVSQMATKNLGAMPKGANLSRSLRMNIYSRWGSVGHLQGSLGPYGPETPKKSEKSLKKVLRPRAPPRVWKKSRKSLFGTFSRLFPDSRDFFQTRGGPRGLVSDFFGVLGPEGPRDPCKWPTGSQY